MACLQTLDSKTAIKQQPATNRIIGPIFRSPKAKKKKVKNGNKRKLWKFPVPQKSGKKVEKIVDISSAPPLRPLKVGVCFLSPTSTTEFEYPTQTQRLKKAKNRIFFHLHRRYLSFWRMQMSRPFPSPKKNLSIEPLPIISRLNCLFSNLFH